MNDKRRLNRVRWVKNSSADEGVSSESNSTPWSAFPMEDVPPQKEVISVENNFTPWSEFQQGNAFGVENNPTPWSAFRQSNATPEGSDAELWLMPPGEGKPSPWAVPPGESPSAPWATPPIEDTFDQEEEVSEENSVGEEEVWGAEEMPADYDPLAEEVYEEDIYDEEEALLLEEERLREEAERRTLRDALLILVALYIVCGVAPLFVGLFVPLRIFFWLEIGGWAIIIAWLVIGVRRPLTRWFKERARKRAEQASEQASEQVAG